MPLEVLVAAPFARLLGFAVSVIWFPFPAEFPVPILVVSDGPLLALGIIVLLELLVASLGVGDVLAGVVLLRADAI